MFDTKHLQSAIETVREVSRRSLDEIKQHDLLAAIESMETLKYLYEVADEIEASPTRRYTLEELRTMHGKPVYLLCGDGTHGWVIVSVDGETVSLYGEWLYELDEDFYDMTYNDPDGHYGLHVLGWVTCDKEEP